MIRLSNIFKRMEQPNENQDQDFHANLDVPTENVEEQGSNEVEETPKSVENAPTGDCTNCTGGLVGDDICTVCNGSGKV